MVDVGLDSFPSGHTTTAAALTFAIALAFPQIWTWALAGVWVASMAVSRTYLLVHWSSDVLAAAVLGASVALLVAAILTAVFQDRSQSRDSLIKPSLVDPSFFGNERASIAVTLIHIRPQTSLVDSLGRMVEQTHLAIELHFARIDLGESLVEHTEVPKPLRRDLLLRTPVGTHVLVDHGRAG